MLARVDSAAVWGVDAYTVRVEVDISPALPSFSLVGLGDRAVQESYERVRAAIRNSNFDFPARRVTVNLAPADTKKEGAAFDLPIALGILMASEQLPRGHLDEFAVVGELSLDGSVRAVNGVLPMTVGARQVGKQAVIVPTDNAHEAAVVEGIDVYPVPSLFEAVSLLTLPNLPEPYPKRSSQEELVEPDYRVDFADVKGQEHAKRALEIAAAGGHNVLMIGPPGSGKTMMARRIPTILPPLSLEEALEVTKLYSVVGMLKRGQALVSTRPFRSPHHTVSTAGLVGGGSFPKPGEVSLAHHGVLFLDELPEFHRDALEVLRQPLEDGQVTISRAMQTLSFPARILLIAAMNPCPCGYATDQTRSCTCSEGQIRRYRMRISGPLLDRIDIHLEIPRLKPDELLEPAHSEPSAKIRQRITKARRLQQERFRGTGIFCNAHMEHKHIRQFCPIDEESKALLKTAISSLGLSARGSDRVLKAARTIADLEDEERIQPRHISEAIAYRTLDREIFG